MGDREDRGERSLQPRSQGDAVLEVCHVWQRTPSVTSEGSVGAEG